MENTEAQVRPLLVGERTAARLLAISGGHLKNMTKAGQVPCVRLGRRVLFSVKALESWIERQQSGGLPGADDCRPDAPEENAIRNRAGFCK
jgi:excisionase family DNA binding protein